MPNYPAIETTALASAIRVASVNGPDILNYYHKYLTIFVNVTLDAESASITPGLEWKDPASGVYEPIWTAAAAFAAVGQFVYQLGPGLVAATGGSYDDTEAIVIPVTTRIIMTAADTDDITYSVGYALT